MKNQSIYLDYNASTPLDPKVRIAIQEASESLFGNPSSSHWAGIPAKTTVENARSQVAGMLGCAPSEVVFTSGGSEANNHAIKGSFYSGRKKGNHIITSRIEHPATIQPCRFLENLGAEVTYLPVDSYGCVNPEDLRKALRPTTILVSIMHANNEVGTIQPIPELSAMAHAAGALFHTDAAQTVGKIPVRVGDLGVDLLSVAGHKFYAPKGVGALYVRSGLQIEPLIHGAGHEVGRRAGTENVLLDVALGAASEQAGGWVKAMAAVAELRDRFWMTLQKDFGSQVRLNGHPRRRLPNTLNISFLGEKTGAEILAAIPQVAASTGSACHAGEVTLSPVLAAMGLSVAEGRGAIRFSLGLATKWEEIHQVTQQIKATLAN
ncbi:MAG: cysteine desulfurase [Spirochaetes bacterium]|nr:cysteine desulfurase [Spirochaetota bacterium]